MEQNELIKQVTNAIKAEILGNLDLMKEIVSVIQLNEENISPKLQRQIMAAAKAEMMGAIEPPTSKSNAPKIKTEKVAERPLIITPGDMNSQIISDLLEGNNVYILGKAGTGKTYAAKAIASAMGLPVYIINCSQWTSPIEIRGGQTIEGYVEGQLTKAWAMGGILILDELPKLDPNTAGLLNDALSEAAAQPKYDENGKVIQSTIPKITNGRGDIIFKGQDQPDEDLKFRFAVIGTGNTNMMDVGTKYGGNQRQDYSLVDRFAGSFYELGNDPVTEKRLTYSYVWNVTNAIRLFLEKKPDSPLSISIRTMLNFNRTFEQDMLFQINSPFADEIFDNNGKKIPPKAIKTSIDSFLGMMDANSRAEIEKDSAFNSARDKMPTEEQFIVEFKLRYHLDPKTKKELTPEQLNQINKFAEENKFPQGFLG